MDCFMQSPPLPLDAADMEDLPPLPLTSMQMSNELYNNHLDFDHGDGGRQVINYEAISDDDDYHGNYGRLPKRRKTESQYSEHRVKQAARGCYDSPEEGEISDDPDVDAGSEGNASRTSRNSGKSDAGPTACTSKEVEIFPSEEISDRRVSADAIDEIDDDDVVFGNNLEKAINGDDFVVAENADVTNDKIGSGPGNQVESNAEFEIIDDLSSDNGDENTGNPGMYSDESEVDVDVDDAEVEAMLEDRVAKTSDGMEMAGVKGVAGKQVASGRTVDFQAPSLQEKIVLVEKGHDPFDIMPEGWLIVTHQSGMPLYLHKQSRVCTVSRPYFLGPGSARKHEIPISALPCLQYARALAASKKSSTNHESPDGISCVGSMPTLLNSGDSGRSSATFVTGEVEAAGDDICAQQDVTSTTMTTVASSDIVATPPARAAPVPTKVQSAEDHKKANSLTPLEFRAYCQRLFEFRTITVRRFRRWKDRRKHNLFLKKASRPTLPPSTNLITCAIPADKDSHASFRRKAFVLNPAGKSAICILHEYAQHTMRIQPRYIFQELENSQMPYSATVVINDVRYGTGFATSKKMAKLEAARVTLAILIPEIGKMKTDEPVVAADRDDLSFFDEIKIEDPRVVDLCNKAGHPTPYQILGECLKRNYGMGDTQIQMEINTVKHQKSEFIMKVGRHEAKVICKNKREGKQQAAQAILQKMHPHITTWGSLLRLYAKANEMKDKREEEYNITKLQTMAHPNKAILEKLKTEMTKLYSKRDAIQSNIKGKLKFSGPEIVSSELQSVDL